MTRTKGSDNSTTEEVTDRIPDGRSIIQGGKIYGHGDEKKFAEAAKGMHPDDLQLMANRGDIIGFGTEFVETEDLDPEASHPVEYAEGRKHETRENAKKAPKAGTADHLKAGKSSARETDETGKADETEGTDSQRRAPAVPDGAASGDKSKVTPKPKGKK